MQLYLVHFIIETAFYRPEYAEKMKEDQLSSTSVIDAEEQKLEVRVIVVVAFFSGTEPVCLHSSIQPLMRQSGNKISRRSSLSQGLLVEQPVVTVSKLDLNALPAGKVTWLYVSMGESPLSQPLSVPVMVMKGKVAGPIVGITSALHGNELNGIPLIHRYVDPTVCHYIRPRLALLILQSFSGSRR